MSNLRILFPTKKQAAATFPTSGLTSRYRADTVSTTVVGPDTFIDSWTDLSGNSLTATNVTSDKAKLITGVVNGQPVGRFPGGVTPPYYQFSLNIGNSSTAVSVLLVTKSTGVPAAGFGVALSLFTSSAAAVALFNSNQANYGAYTIGGGAAVATNINNSFDISAAWSGMVQTYNGSGNYNSNSNWSVYGNNVLQTMSNGTGPVNTVSVTKSYIGIFVLASLLPYTGDIAEIATWDHALNSTERSNLHGYLNGRYGSGVG